jgi:hypothetical protein
MNHQADSIESLLALRKVTRAIADAVREQMKGYLSTLSPLLRPRLVFGDYVQGTTKETAKHADTAYKEFVALHDQLLGAKPFSLRTPLNPPLRIASTGLDVSPLEYSYAIRSGEDERPVLVRSPLKWVLSYSGFGPARLKELLSSRQRSAEELHDFLVHYLVIHVVTNHQKGVTDMLGTLHFPVTTEKFEEFGDLPVTCISCSVTTKRPADDIVIQSAELSGMDAFEEVVHLEDLSALSDPLKEKLVGLVKGLGFTV